MALPVGGRAGAIQNRHAVGPYERTCWAVVRAWAGGHALAGGSLAGQLVWATGPQFVDILFVVSGFVVFLPTVAQRGNFGSVPGYAIRRGARLLPAYWLSLCVMLKLPLASV